LELACEDERLVRRGGDVHRLSRLVRRRFDRAGALVAAETIGENDKRVLAHAELGRSCITCDEFACAERPAEPVLVSLKARP
jgi:hypothetical protein